jgi:8-oxo-dGTP pyrophosphatase MutT (NUDIX family)
MNIEDNTNNATWGSTNVTFSGIKNKQTEENIPEKNSNESPKTADDKSIKYSPNIIQNHEVIFDNNWLKLKKNKNFIYSEIKGVDSVAFILISTNISDERRVGLINEYKDPIDKFMVTAFGGSIDNEKYHTDLRLLVKDEVMEEAGFEVSVNEIDYYGKVLVSTQMNQFCHLFSVRVDKTKQKERTTTNPTEMLSNVQWLTLPELKQTEDWKAITIISKRLMEQEAIARVSRKNS